MLLVSTSGFSLSSLLFHHFSPFLYVSACLYLLPHPCLFLSLSLFVSMSLRFLLSLPLPPSLRMSLITRVQCSPLPSSSFLVFRSSLPLLVSPCEYLSPLLASLYVSPIRCLCGSVCPASHLSSLPFLLSSSTRPQQMKWNVPSCRELARAQLSVLEGAADRWPGDPGSLGKPRRLSPNTVGPLWKLSTPSCRFQDGRGACFRISDLGGKPKPCLPAPGDSMHWALTQEQVQKPSSWGRRNLQEHHQGTRLRLHGEGIHELRSHGDRMRSWKGYGVHRFYRSFTQQTIMKPPPEAGLALQPRRIRHGPCPQKAHIFPQAACREHTLTEAARGCGKIIPAAVRRAH